MTKAGLSFMLGPAFVVSVFLDCLSFPAFGD